MIHIADTILTALMAGEPVTGRHVVVVAHPDDEAISFGGALSCLADVVIVQLTEDTLLREAERAAAQVAGGWNIQVIFGGARFREAHLEAGRLRSIVATALVGADVVWTHPYEGGHIDHDTAAWLVQSMALSALRMEFASYHSTGGKGQVFGDFWPDPACPAVAAVLSGERLARKQAAIAAYGSQAHIVQKFPHPEREAYRVAPRYDFTQPPPPPQARWDVKGYQPSTAEWRRAISQVEQVSA